MRSNAVHFGRNSDFGTRDDRYVRCKRCGFICNTDRDSRGREGSRQGWGISFVEQDVMTGSSTSYDDDNIDYDSTSIEYDNDDVARTIYDPVVVAGCPNCGTLLY